MQFKGMNPVYYYSGSIGFLAINVIGAIFIPNI